MFGSKNKVDVTIGGYNYTLVGKDPIEYLNKLAAYIDKKINSIMKENNKLGLTAAAILTAFNIADDYFKNVDGEKNRGEIERLNAEVERLNAENEEIKRQLNDKNNEFDAVDNIDQNNFKSELKESYSKIEDLLLERDKFLEDISSINEENTNLHLEIIELKVALTELKENIEMQNKINV